MALNFRSIVPAELTGSGHWSEQLVTIGAASFALLIVAAIAVLMGMA